MQASLSISKPGWMPEQRLSSSLSQDQKAAPCICAEPCCSQWWNWCLSPRQQSGFNSKFQVHAPPLAGFLLDCCLVFHQSNSFAFWRIVFSAICPQIPSPNISNRHILQSSCRKSARQFIYRKIPFLPPSSWCNVNTTSE